MRGRVARLIGRAGLPHPGKPDMRLRLEARDARLERPRPRLRLGAAALIERAVLGRRHQPGGGIVRNAVLGPALERDDQRILRQLFSDADVARDARQRGDDP